MSSSQARQSLPKDLVIRASSIPTSGLGIFTTKPIPVGTKYGPYIGKTITNKDLTDDVDASYVWEVGL